MTESTVRRTPTASGKRTPARRGRPPASEAPSVATEDRILEAAAELLGTHGYSDTKLDQIADMAGIRTPAIYHYFGSRDELIAAVMREGQSRLREHVERELSAAPAEASAIDRICVGVRAHLMAELELSDYARAVMRNASQAPPAIREKIRADGAAYYSIWRELIQDAVRSGEIRADIDPSIARMLIMGAMNWTAEWWDASRPIEPLIDTALTMIRAALTSPGESLPGWSLTGP